MLQQKGNFFGPKRALGTQRVDGTIESTGYEMNIKQKTIYWFVNNLKTTAQLYAD